MSEIENQYVIPVAPEIPKEALAELQEWAQKLDWLLDAPEARDMPRAVAQTGILERMGRGLWDGSGLDAEALLEKIEEAKDDDECVRLVIQGDAHYGLPWELLWHEHPDLGFLGRHPRCIVTRRVRGTGKEPTAAPRPLRMLLFIASPDDLDPERSRLDFEREEELLFTALDGPYSRGEIEVEVAGDGFLSTLVERLSQERFHAVILSMHGTDAVNRDGKAEWGLLFEDEMTWKKKPVAGSDLAKVFEGLPKGHRPGLVVLAACRSAKAGETAESIPDVARQLHQKAGVERVLGMRLSVLDSAASAFNAALFSNLALGESVGRAVSLAREVVGSGAWLRESMGERVKTDLYAQWTLPVLLDRTQDGPVVDMKAEAQVTPRLPLPDALPGDGSVPVPSRAAFIGRRMEIRQWLGPFLSGKARHLLFTGPGGVGKTALAGLFARHLMDRNPGMRVMGFRAPFNLDSVYEPIREAAFDGEEEQGLHDFIQKEPEQKERLRRMLVSLDRRERRCAFVLDNLETLQDLQTLGIAAEHAESRWFLNAICGLPGAVPVLMTGRYALDGEIDGPVVRHPVGEAPYGDILRRMKRLEWPESMGPEKKRWVYRVLGGNHRAIEWTAQLLGDAAKKAEELLKALERVAAPTDTPEGAVATVTEAMRQNLLFRELRAELTDEQDRLLRAASLYRVPVNEDGLAVIDPDAENVGGNRERLLAYALLEEVQERSLGLTYYIVPPVVRELMGDSGFDEGKLKALHLEMGRYHRFQGRHVSQTWSDDLEAIHHFRRAGEHEDADELADGVSNFYHNRDNYADAAKILAEIAARPAPPPPWWALNRYGLCQDTLGFYQSALDAYERALPLSPTKKEKGTT